MYCPKSRPETIFISSLLITGTVIKFYKLHLYEDQSLRSSSCVMPSLALSNLSCKYLGGVVTGGIYLRALERSFSIIRHLLGKSAGQHHGCRPGEIWLVLVWEVDLPSVDRDRNPTRLGARSPPQPVSAPYNMLMDVHSFIHLSTSTGGCLWGS